MSDDLKSMGPLQEIDLIETVKVDRVRRDH